MQGDRVVVPGQAQLTRSTGILLRASQIQMAGVGDLLAEIERRRRLLADEGLFAEHHKRRWPFPRRVGVVTGVTGRPQRRPADCDGPLPRVRLEVRQTAVQGARRSPR